MKAFTFLEPGSLQEALQLLQAAGGRARVIAGGSDLLGELKEGIASYETLVSLGALDELKRIERSGERLRIGALVSLARLEAGEGLEGPYALLAEAARGVATPEVRNQGTLGGNLCQRPRCLYYRSVLTPCLKKGADGCPAFDSPYQAYLSVMGGSGCYAVNASDLAPPLIALGASALLRGPQGEREVSLEEFFVGPDPDPARETCLAEGEVLTAVSLPPMPPAWRGTYMKGRERTAGDFPVVSLALGYELDGGRIQDSRLVLGGLAPVPLRRREAESVLDGEEPSEEVAARAATAALAGASPLAHNAYKLDLARALILRGVVRLASPA